MTFHFPQGATASLSTTPQARMRPRGFYERRIKRWFEVGLIVLTAPLTAGLLLVMVFATMLDGHNPFFSQRRIGRGGRAFRIWKIRTMVPNAEARLIQHLRESPTAQREWTATQKLRNDPRVTRLGRVLRKLSLDEIPQFWNVLRGDMALIGPRPMMPDQQDLYSGQAYYRLRPGITGLWQVSDRNACTFRKRARFDTLYASRVTFLGDMSILLRTIAIVARGTGC